MKPRVNYGEGKVRLGNMKAGKEEYWRREKLSIFNVSGARVKGAEGRYKTIPDRTSSKPVPYKHPRKAFNDRRFFLGHVPPL